jgi:signal transduction histidine kinase
VSIRIAVTDDTVTLEVLDDGTGLGNPNRSSGLTNLHPNRW